MCCVDSTPSHLSSNQTPVTIASAFRQLGAGGMGRKNIYLNWWDLGPLSPDMKPEKPCLRQRSWVIHTTSYSFACLVVGTSLHYSWSVSVSHTASCWVRHLVSSTTSSPSKISASAERTGRCFFLKPYHSDQLQLNHIIQISCNAQNEDTYRTDYHRFVQYRSFVMFEVLSQCLRKATWIRKVIKTLLSIIPSGKLQGSARSALALR